MTSSETPRNIGQQVQRPPQILIIEDDIGVRGIIRASLKEEGYHTTEVATGAKALEQIRGPRRGHRRFDLVMLDVKLPDMDGLDVFTQIRKARPRLPIVIMTAHPRDDLAIDLVTEGAASYLPKPFDIDKMLELIRRELVLSTEAEEITKLRDEYRQNPPRYGLVGDSPTMQKVYQQIGLLARNRSSARVLITGETGTGKTRVAATLHKTSPRATGPFEEVNCANLPENALESELFGHVKGSFTSGIYEREGRFTLAHGGTLFLDEIGNMSPGTQEKILGVINNGTFRKYGGSEDIRTDVRIISATHEDLLANIAVGEFRSDLYHRLRVVEINLPPLRERKEDIPKILAYTLSRLRDGTTMISQKALEKLLRYDWPGNVRELENIIERAIALSPNRIIDEDGIQIEPESRLVVSPEQAAREGRPFTETLNLVYADYELRMIRAALELEKGNISRVAARLHIDPEEMEAIVRDLRIKFSP